MNVGKKLSLILLATFAGATPNLLAVISVGPAGSGTLTFDTLPEAADISCKVIISASSTFADAGGLGTAIQTNSSAMITNPVQADAGNPPSANANVRWSSSGLYLQTRPAGVAATLLMATFRNDTGAPITGAMNLSYTLRVVAPVTEQVGHLVFYSLSGLENTWVQIPDISNLPDDNLPGTYVRRATLDFSAIPWVAGTFFYVLWADDNGSGSPDTAMQIDDLALRSCPVPLFVSDPANATIEQCRQTNLIVNIFDCGGGPVTLQWYKDGAPIDINVNPTAATTNLVIGNAQPSDAGTYFARATNPSGFKDSAPATLTVRPDNTPPVLGYAFVASDLVTITLVFSEPVNAAAEDSSNYALCETLNPGNCVGVVFTSISHDRRTVTLTSEPRTAGAFYTIHVENIGDTCLSNIITPADIRCSSEFPLLLADDLTLWRYNHEGVDLGTAWRAPLYDDSSWSNGYAALGVHYAPPDDPPLRTVLLLNNTNFPFETRKIPTYYFRAHFEFPGDPAASSSRLKMRGAFNDFAYIYINGVEVYRDGVLGTVGEPELLFASYVGGAIGGSGTWSPSFSYIPLTTVVRGDNVVAVQLKQQSGEGSEVYMALELVAELAEAVPSPSLCAFLDLAADGSPRARIVWPCPGQSLITGYVLQSANDLAGPWTTVTGAKSPYVIPASATRKFYRLRHE